MGECQTKESTGRTMWEHYKTISPAKQDFSREEGLSSLPEGEWAVAESQRGMTQDEVKIVCQGATPWKTGIFLRGRVELFTRGWVSYCWVSMRDYAENVKNNYKTDEGNKKESINILFCATEYIRKFFHPQVKIYKDSYKLFIMSRDLCSEEFLLNVWSQKKSKKESYSFY